MKLLKFSSDFDGGVPNHFFGKNSTKVTPGLKQRSLIQSYYCVQHLTVSSKILCKHLLKCPLVHILNVKKQTCKQSINIAIFWLVQGSYMSFDLEFFACSCDMLRFQIQVFFLETIHDRTKIRGVLIHFLWTCQSAVFYMSLTSRLS